MKIPTSKKFKKIQLTCEIDGYKFGTTIEGDNINENSTKLMFESVLNSFNVIKELGLEEGSRLMKQENREELFAYGRKKVYEDL